MNGENGLSLLGLSIQQLESWAKEQGQPPFRGRHIHDWIYSKGAKDLDEITVLPKQWRKLLQENGVRLGRLKEVGRHVSNDKTIKLLLETFDGEKVETVGIPTDEEDVVS